MAARFAVRGHGEVTELRMWGAVWGRPVYPVSAYFVDGTLIDTGPPQTGPALAGWLAGRPLEQVWISHHHEDHMGGAWFLHDRDAPFFAPAAGREMIAHPRRIPLYRRLTFGQPRGVDTRPFAAHMPLARDRYEACIIPTPGHAPDHTVFFVPQTGWLFAADLYVEPRGKYLRRRDDLQGWYDSIRRVLALDFGELFCAHAGRIPDGPAALRQKIAWWEDLAGLVQQLHAQGLSERQIQKQLLGREKLLTYWSQGTYAKRHLIRALRSLRMTSS